MSAKAVCTICQVQCDTDQQLKIHESGKKHRSKCILLYHEDALNELGQEVKISPPKQVTPTNSTFDLSLLLPDETVTSCSRSSGNGHLSTLKTPSDFYCSTCNVSLNSIAQYTEHVQGQKHLKKVKSATTPSHHNHTEGNSSTVKTNTQDQISSALSVDAVTELIEKLRKPSTVVRDLSDPPPRRIARSCRKLLSEIWPGVTFTPAESYTLLAASECEDDCVLRLDRGKDGWFRVGIHLVTALLEANRIICRAQSASRMCGSTEHDGGDMEMLVPTAVWIAPQASEGPDPTLFSYFQFVTPCGDNESDLSIRVVTSSKGVTLPKFDVLLTDPDYFVDNFLSIVLLNTVCCFVIQDIQTISQHKRFCSAIGGYLHQFDVASHRARMICLSTSRVQLNPPFGKFRDIRCNPTLTEA